MANRKRTVLQFWWAMGKSTYDTFGVALAILVGLIVFPGVVKSSSGNDKFPDRNDAKWLALIAIWAVISPMLYCWGAPVRMTLEDAYMLRITTAGWTYVAMGYCAFAGMLFGGLVALLTKSK